MAESNRYKILVTGTPLADEVKKAFEEIVSLRVTPANPTSEQIASLAAEERVSAIIVRQGQITREVLAASENLKVVSKHGVGVDNIDIEAATDLKIPVCNTPNANYMAVAEHAFAMMFALAKNLTLHDQRIRSGIWEKVLTPGIEIFGKCLGIIGTGRIGRRLAEIARPHQMTIVGYDPLYCGNDFPDGIRRAETKEELLKQADFVSIHCPKTPDTIGMIGEKEFRIMKTNAIIINTARGGLIDEPALIEALQTGKIGGAGLDCFSCEPLPQDSPLMSMKEKIIMTPHAGGSTHEALIRMGMDAVRNVLAFLQGKEIPIDAVLNPKVIQDRSNNRKP